MEINIKRKNILENSLCCLLAFMYIFSFKIYSVIDSAILVFIGLTLYAIINAPYREKMINQFKKKNYIYIGIAILLIILWGLTAQFINNSNDFSYIKTIVHLSISIITGLELLGYYIYKEKQDKIVNYIIISFIIQTCLQWFFFLAPNISKFFNIFRTKSAIINNIKYSGNRGLAISSSGFFGLSSAYGLAAILYWTKYNTLFKNYILKILFFLIMYAGTLFAGRTGFVALPFVFIILIYRIIKNRKQIISKINYKIIILFICFILIVALVVMVTLKNRKFSNMYKYAFEPFINIFSGNKNVTTSTNTLLSMYDREISAKTFLIGDSKYTVMQDGEKRYYMNTDVGYYRKIYYFGIVGLFLSFILQLFIMKKTRWENYLIFLFLAVLELKGEIIGISIIVNAILLLYANTEKLKERNIINERSNCVNDNIS